MRIVHISSVHPWKDPRIFLKQCRSLAAQGFDVHLLTPDSLNEVREGVQLHRVWNQDPAKLDKSVWGKLMRPAMLFKMARRLKPDVIHFHDPELIPWALVHRAIGYTMVYDIHEDNMTVIRHRNYIPSYLKGLLSSLVGWIEGLAHSVMPTVLAEAYYQHRFPKGIVVANYHNIPVNQEEISLESGPVNAEGESHVLYTGNIEIERGVIKYLEGIRGTSNVHLHLIGRTYQLTFDKTLDAQKGIEERIHWEGVGSYVPFSRILGRYAERNWLAGLVVFPYSDHYQNKLLTKFFEYMAFGIPIIYTDFSEWKKLLDPLEVGIAVNPEKPAELVSAIERLREDQILWQTYAKNALHHSKQFSWEHEAVKLTTLYNELSEHHDGK
ncbi:glycosyltransferase [Balneolaceae bacterium]|nr:glycosyltransferase [Balneolaceae bacterium]